MIAINDDRRFDHLQDVPPRFRPGDLVRHRRYGYRGVIAHADGHCRADPEWYMSNQTQPDRQQPWYHVLVDGGSTVTYAAESSLLPDTDQTPVEHALLSYFFEGFANGRHLRNGEPWPDV